MVKDHSDSEKGNPLPPHRLLFSINSKVFFYIHHPTDRVAFVTPVVEHWLEREIAQSQVTTSGCNTNVRQINFLKEDILA